MGLKYLAPVAIIGLAISLYVVSATVPDALENIFAVNTSTWDAGAAALWGILGLVVVAALLLIFVPGGTKGE